MKRILMAMGLAAALLACSRSGGVMQGGPAVSEAWFASEVEQAPGAVLVDFWAKWCGPCRAMKPVFERVEQDFSNQVKFVKIDVDANPDLAAKFRIEAIPTLVFFSAGKVTDTKLGAMSEKDLRAWLSTNLAAAGRTGT